MEKFLALLLSIVCLFSGCKGGYKHSKFKTEYTVEEHIARIEERTKERFEEEIASGELVSYNVDIVYAFYDNDPEYFLVELEYVNEWENLIDENSPEYGTYTTKYKHLIGYIEEDNYWTGLPGYSIEFMNGRSAYKLLGCEKSRKYYGGGVQAVERDGELIMIFDNDCLFNLDNSYGYTVEFHLHDTSKGDDLCFDHAVVPQEVHKNLMKSNYKWGGGKY